MTVETTNPDIQPLLSEVMAQINQGKERIIELDDPLTVHMFMCHMITALLSESIKPGQLSDWANKLAN